MAMLVVMNDDDDDDDDDLIQHIPLYSIACLAIDFSPSFHVHLYLFDSPAMPRTVHFLSSDHGTASYRLGF